MQKCKTKCIHCDIWYHYYISLFTKQGGILAYIICSFIPGSGPWGPIPGNSVCIICWRICSMGKQPHYDSGIRSMLCLYISNAKLHLFFTFQIVVLLPKALSCHILLTYTWFYLVMMLQKREIECLRLNCIFYWFAKCLYCIITSGKLCAIWR